MFETLEQANIGIFFIFLETTTTTTTSPLVDQYIVYLSTDLASFCGSVLVTPTTSVCREIPPTPDWTAKNIRMHPPQAVHILCFTVMHSLFCRCIMSWLRSCWMT